MRVLISTAGSHGDVLPFVALARKFAGRGHEAIVHERCRLIAKRFGEGVDSIEGTYNAICNRAIGFGMIRDVT